MAAKLVKTISDMEVEFYSVYDHRADERFCLAVIEVDGRCTTVSKAKTLEECARKAEQALESVELVEKSFPDSKAKARRASETPRRRSRGK